MKRRCIVAMVGGATLAAALPVVAQTAPKVYRIGVLSLLHPREGFLLTATLRELGYEEGRNFVFEFRFAQGQDDRLPALAAELVATKVNLIVAMLNPEILAAKRATSTIPIVMMYAMAPTEIELVASLARPGANVTGTTIQGSETAGKILQMLRDVAPRVKRIALLFEPDFPGMNLYRLATERAATALGIQLMLLAGRTVAELDNGLAIIARERPDALYVVPTGAIVAQRARVIEFAAQRRLPTIYTAKLLVTEGGLMSYTADTSGIARRTAAITDRILKGAKPADIPVEQPTRYELVINMKTAKAMGLTIPQTVLLQATELIE